VDGEGGREGSDGDTWVWSNLLVLEVGCCEVLGEIEDGTGLLDGYCG